MLLPIALFLIFSIFCYLLCEPVALKWVATKAEKNPIIPVIAGILIVLLVFSALIFDSSFDSFTYLNFTR